MRVKKTPGTARPQNTAGQGIWSIAKYLLFFAIFGAVGYAAYQQFYKQEVDPALTKIPGDSGQRQAKYLAAKQQLALAINDLSDAQQEFSKVKAAAETAAKRLKSSLSTLKRGQDEYGRDHDTVLKSEENLLWAKNHYDGSNNRAAKVSEMRVNNAQEELERYRDHEYISKNNLEEKQGKANEMTAADANATALAAEARKKLSQFEQTIAGLRHTCDVLKPNDDEASTAPDQIDK